MIADYVKLGFAKKLLYLDDETSAFPLARKTIRGIDTRRNHPCGFLLRYFKVLAPPGVGSDKKRAQLKQFFKTRCSQGA